MPLNDQIENDGQFETENICFDDLLLKLGKFGRYQKFTYILIALPIICDSFFTMNWTFMLGKHDHRCSVNGFVNDTYWPYGEERTLLTNNSEGKTITTIYSQCTIKTNNTDGNNTTSKCDSWVYDKSIFQTTVISDLHLVCDNVILQSHAVMIPCVGALFGCMTFMSLADVVGRKPVLCSTLIFMFVFDFAIAWAPSFLFYGIFTFMYGTAGATYWGLAVITSLELVHPTKRELAGVSLNYFWCLGELILAGLAYGLRSWRNLQLATSSTFGLFIFYYFMIDESPRWLLSKGRNAEAHVIIRKIAKWNRVELTEDIIEAVYDAIDPNDNVTLLSTCRHIVRSSKVMFWLAIVYFNLFVLYMSYSGIIINISTLGGNVYIDFLISATVELAGTFFCHLMLNRVGRRLILCSAMIIGGLSSFCAIFTVIVTQDAPEWINIILSTLVKLGMSFAFGVIYIIQGEITPTPIRGAACGIGAMVGLVGNIAAPYIAKMNNLVTTGFGNALYLIVFGVLMFCAGMAALLLPETQNRKLPDTLKEAEQLKSFGRKGNGNKGYSLNIYIREET